MSTPPALDEIASRAGGHHLAPLGALHLDKGEVPGYASLVLLGPQEPGYWGHFTQTPEYRDGARDPMNRWSACVIGALADALGPRGYDVPACKADLDRPGKDCRARGCAVRRACPISQSHGRTEAQSAFHMGYFG